MRSTRLAAKCLAADALGGSDDDRHGKAETIQRMDVLILPVRAVFARAQLERLGFLGSSIASPNPGGRLQDENKSSQASLASSATLLHVGALWERFL